MNNITVQRKPIKFMEVGNKVLYLKFKKHRLPRKYKKAQIKLGNRKFLKLIASSNFISYDGGTGFDNFCNSLKLVYKSPYKIVRK